MKLDTRIPLRNLNGEQMTEDHQARDENGNVRFDGNNQPIVVKGKKLFIAEYMANALISVPQSRDSAPISHLKGTERMVLALKIQTAYNNGQFVELKSDEQENIKQCAAIFPPLIVGQIVMALDEKLDELFPDNAVVQLNSAAAT